MIIKFKNGVSQKCKNASETMLFKNGIPAAWLFNADIEISNSLEAERIFTYKNISKISLLDDETQKVSDISYEAVNSVVISYSDGVPIAQVQLKRSINNG